ncbi:MAG: NFACT family protein [Candidatus Cloacimonadota bacterium]|nr:NFACT family protein [Candidatus Cloacimonadota bacterium]
MDLLFLQLWKKEFQDEILNRGFRRARFSDGEYKLEFSNTFLHIFPHSGDSICFSSNHIEIEKQISRRKDDAIGLSEENGFTKILNTHLKKCKVTKIEMAENDRIIFLYFQKHDIFGINIEYKLIIELINRYENLIFTRKSEDNKWQIIDCHKKIGIADSRFRQILPGLEYCPPPKQKKPNIFNVNQFEFDKLVSKHFPEKWNDFIRNFSDMPKFLSEKYSDNKSAEKFWTIIENTKIMINKIYSIIRENGNEDLQEFIVFFNTSNKYLSLYESEDTYGFLDINSAFKYYYDEKLKKNYLHNLKSRILKYYRKKRKSLKKALKIQKKELEQLERIDDWKKFGELLKTQLHQIKPRQRVISVIDYFSENPSEIEIPLNPEWDAKRNMEFYFKKYKKAKSGIENLNKQISKNQEEFREIENLITYIENTDDEEYLSQLSVEKNQRSKRKVPEQKTKFRTFDFVGKKREWKIYVGRKRKENDELTTKFANSDDWFFHSRIYHGSHVIVRNPDRSESLPQNVTIYAARLAAHFSKAKHSANVPVDFTKIKYVSKPRKSPPGFVIYRNQKTIFVDPLDPRK